MLTRLSSVGEVPVSSPELKPAKKLDLLLHNSPLAMIEWTKDLIIVGWNAAAAELFSFFEEEALGERIDTLLAQRQITELSSDDWTNCNRTGVLREHIGINGKKLCRWFNTPFIQRGNHVSTLSTIIDTTAQTVVSNEELRSQLQSRTQVLKHTTARLQSAISDRAQTYAALHESESRFQSIAANMPGILYQFCLQQDGQFSIPYISAAAEEVYGISADTLQNNPENLFTLVHPEDRVALEQSMHESAQKLSAWNSEHRLTTPDGQLKWVQMASRPQPAPTGSTLWSGVIIDITARKQTEASLQKSEFKLRAQTKQLKATLKKLKHAQVKLVQSEKMSSLGQLVAGIAHEINNPINFIYGNITHIKEYAQDMLQLIRLYQAHHPTPHSTIQTLTSELDLDYVVSDLPKLLDSVQLGTERIRKIVLSLRNFSRLDESGIKRIDVHEGLENALMLLSSRLKATIFRPNIKVIKAYERIPTVACYANQLNQVFMDILVNAVDAIDEMTEANLNLSSSDQSSGQSSGQTANQVILQTFAKERHVVIQITNDGPPIPSQVSSRMFDPFFTTKEVGKGTGMGLAISYQTVVDLHQGTLEYKTTTDGHPAFLIEIPISQPLQQG
ncbi:MAG: PAS domain S-box protein [Cyanobacteria bacterium J06621_11]